MKQALFLTIAFFTLSFFSYGQKKSTEGKNLSHEFKEISYDKVVAYELDTMGFIVENGLLNTDIIKNKKVLSQAQIDTLQQLLYLTKKTNEKLTKECYSNRIGFVYYLNDKIVANLSITKDCNVFFIYVKTLTDGVDNYSNATINYYSFQRMSFDENGKDKLTEFYSDLNFY